MIPIANSDRAAADFSAVDLAAVLGAIAEGVTVQDSSRQLVYANAAAARVMGFRSVEELLNTPVEEIRNSYRIFDEDGQPFPPDQLPGQLVLSEKEARPTVLRYVNLKTGQERWSLVKALPVMDENGQVRYAVNVFTDITDTKQSERDAALAAARLTSILETAVNGIVSIDRSGTIQMVNPAVTRLFGYEPDEMVGRNVSMLMPEPYRSGHDSYLRSYLDTREPKIIGSPREVEGRRKDGSTFPLELAVSEGTVNGEEIFTGIIRDLTSLKRSEHAAIAYAEQARLAIEGGELGIWEYSFKDETVSFDARCRELFGLQAKVPVSTDDLRKRIHSDDVERVAASFRAALDLRTSSSFDEEFRVVLPGGQIRWIASRGEFGFEGEGDARRAVRFVGTFRDVTVRMQAEESLRQSEQRFRNIFDTAGVSVLVQDFTSAYEEITRLRANGVRDFRSYFMEHPDFVRMALGRVRIVDVNRETLSLLGAQSKQELFNSLADIILPETEQIFVEELTALAEERDTLEMETSVRSLDGRRVSIQFTIHFGHHRSDLSRVVVTAVDITRHRQVQEELRQQAEELQALLDTLPVGVFFAHDPRAEVITGNRASHDLMRVPEGENLSKSAPAGQQPGFRLYKDGVEIPPDQLPVQRAARGETIRNEELRQVFEDGSGQDVLVSAAPLLDADGQPRGSVASVMDITERRRAEEALRESEEQFRQTFENAGLGITMIGLDRRWMRVNKRFCEIVGYPEEELVGKDVFDITFEEDRWVDAQSGALRQGKTAHAVLEKRYVHRDRRIVWAKVTSSVQRDRNGNALYWVSVVEDISDRKRAEMRLSAQHSVAQVLATTRTLEEAAPQFLEALCGSLKMDIGELWLSEDEGQTIYCSQIHIVEGFEHRDRWMEMTRNTRFRTGENLPGIVWETRKPRWRPDVPSGPPSPRRELGISSGLSSNMAFPIVAGDRCRGVVFLHAKRRLVIDETLEAWLVSLGQDIGQFILREQAEDALRQANATLEERVRERTAELETVADRLRMLANELTETEQRERRRMAQVIHDHLQQLLVAAKMRVEAAISVSNEESVGGHLRDASDLLQQSVNSSRSLSAELRPPVLYEDGFVAGLHWLARWMERTHRIDVTVIADPDAEPPVDRGGILLFESVRELLLNAAKYAETDRAEIRLEKHGQDFIQITVSDEGNGFDPAELEKRTVDVGGFGLFSIRERLQVTGGSLHIKSAPGAGTTVRLTVPAREMGKHDTESLSARSRAN